MQLHGKGYEGVLLFFQNKKIVLIIFPVARGIHRETLVKIRAGKCLPRFTIKFRQHRHLARYAHILSGCFDANIVPGDTRSSF